MAHSLGQDAKKINFNHDAKVDSNLKPKNLLPQAKMLKVGIMFDILTSGLVQTICFQG